MRKRLLGLRHYHLSENSVDFGLMAGRCHTLSHNQLLLTCITMHSMLEKNSPALGLAQFVRVNHYLGTDTVIWLAYRSRWHAESSLGQPRSSDQPEHHFTSENEIRSQDDVPFFLANMLISRYHWQVRNIISFKTRHCGKPTISVNLNQYSPRYMVTTTHRIMGQSI